MQLNAIPVVVALIIGLTTPSVLPYVARHIARVPALPESVSISVPFFVQAPEGAWDDLRQKQGCEEAAALMAVSWARGQSFTTKSAEEVIVDASEYEEKQYGGYIDTSAADTAQRIFKEYFNYQNVSVVYNIKLADIERTLADGNLVIVPVDGTKLGNPWYKQQPGPPHHMVLIHGYDQTSGVFIAHDPGTSNGENYSISEATLVAALRDYPSSAKDAGTIDRTAMIIVSKNL